jgi:chromosome segregation ATPase
LYLIGSLCFIMYQDLVESFSKKTSDLEAELSRARKCSDDTVEKLQDTEGKCKQLRHNLEKYTSYN